VSVSALARCATTYAIDAAEYLVWEKPRSRYDLIRYSTFAIALLAFPVPKARTNEMVFATVDFLLELVNSGTSQDVRFLHSRFLFGNASTLGASFFSQLSFRQDARSIMLSQGRLYWFGLYRTFLSAMQKVRELQHKPAQADITFS